MGVFYMSGYDWHCDGCGRIMNNQIGFTTDDGEWTCSECGYLNDVSPNNIEHYSGVPASENQLRYIRKIEDVLDINFYGSSFEEASDFIEGNKDLYEDRLHTAYKYR